MRNRAGMGRAGRRAGLGWPLSGARRARAAEMEEARERHRAALPLEPPQMAGFRIACAWQGAREVGGDYLDVFPLEAKGGRPGSGDGAGSGRRMALCVGDVSGRGMEAVELMIQLREAVRALAPEAGSPAELCTRVNQALSGSLSLEKYITMIYGTLGEAADGAERRFEYEIAGHCLPLLVRADGAIEFPAGFSGVVGIFSHWLYRNQAVGLGQGDRLLLLTDGILSAEGRRREEFGYARLVKVVEARRGADPAELSREVMAAVARFCRGRFRDDASLIVVGVD